MNVQKKNRRTFLQTAAAGTAAWMVMNPKTALGSKANSKITLGVIGAGGRGRFVIRKFKLTCPDDVEIVAVHDYFEDEAKRTQETFELNNIPSYTGLHGYREILGSNVDGVIITSPPYFHPEHAQNAVEAQKHVWLSKPIAIDVPGAQSIKDTGHKAEGKVTFLVDFQSRNSPNFKEAIKRVHEGAIGKIVTGEAFNQFPAAGKKNTEGMTTDAALLRNWGTNNILSGDCIVEQAVHAVDIANWIIGACPTKAFATGGQKVRTHAGNNYDHFIVTYWYGDDAVVDLNCSQFMNGYMNLGARMFGPKGSVHAHYRGIDWGTGPVKITGENPWPGTELDNTWDIGIENNCRDFVQSLRSGKFINHAEYAADSTLTAILGRDAAYKGGELTWDEMLKANKKLDAGLKL